MASPKPPRRLPKKPPPPKKPVEPPQAAESDAPAATGSPPFIPVTQMPTNSDAIVNNLIAREIRHPSGPNEPPSENILLMRALATGLADGNITAIKERLERKAAHQVEKAQLMESVTNSETINRIALWTEAQSNTEQVFVRATRRGDMTTAEAVAVWHISQNVLRDCRAIIDKTKAVDSASVVEKIDIKTQEVDKNIREKWSGTSPQGREIIRKKLHAFKKKLASVEKTAPKSAK